MDNQRRVILIHQEIIQQRSPDPPVAVRKRMDVLEAGMKIRRRFQNIVNIALIKFG